MFDKYSYLNQTSDNDELSFTGTQINYYFICLRKLWLFSHHIELENESDLVKLGSLLHKERYKKKHKEIQLDKIKLDFVEKGNEIHEIKRSRKLEDAHAYQLLYYLFFIKKKFNLSMKEVLNYPLLKTKISIKLTEEKENEILDLLRN